MVKDGGTDPAHRPQTAPTARRPRPLTFIQPIAEAVVDHALLPRGHHADGLLAHVRAVVDVVFKDKYLVWRKETRALNKEVAVNGAHGKSVPRGVVCISTTHYRTQQGWSQGRVGIPHL